MKYLGYILKIVPYLIINYWRIFKNAVFKKKISYVNFVVKSVKIVILYVIMKGIVKITQIDKSLTLLNIINHLIKLSVINI